jgi:hypothetical protein
MFSSSSGSRLSASNNTFQSNIWQTSQNATKTACPFTHKSSLVGEATILSHLSPKYNIAQAKRLKRSQLNRN